MKLTVSETAKLTGISVRTLHYYDAMGLLHPAELSEAGYRYYGEAELERLQQILFYKELDFPLKEIEQIMNQPSYSRDETLRRQKELLQMKQERLQRLIGLIDSNLKGEYDMSFEEFDMSEIEKVKETYASEVKERWGNTDAYAQSEQKTKGYTKEDWKRITEESDEIMKTFADLRESAPDAKATQEAVKKWQDFITANYYDCSKEILAGLGSMYVADERFRQNIDKFGEGTAQCMSDAIAAYCK